MTPQELFESLESLEQTLQNIESARQQVVSTVNAYDGARQQLSRLVNDVTSLLAELNTIFTTIKTNQSSITSQIDTEVSQLISELKSKVGIVETEANNIQTKFSSECEATSKNITDKANAALAKINSDLEVLCSHYKTSSENASALINSSVTEGINTLKLAVVKAQEDLCNSTKTEEGKLNTAFAQLTSSVEELQANFRNESSRLIDDQKSSLTEAATAFSNKIAGHVQSLTDLESQLKTILTQASFEAIQTKIGEVKATVLSTKDSFDSSLSAFKTTCENWNTTQIESLTQFIQKIDSLDSSLSALKTSCESWSNEQKESDKDSDAQQNHWVV